MDPSLMTTKEAAEHLAMRAALGRGREKKADVDWSAIGDKLKSVYNNLSAGRNPAGSPTENIGWEAGRNALIGAGIGGAAGLGRSMFSRERRKDPMNDILTGMALGGGLGGGGTLAYRGANRLMPDAFGEPQDTELIDGIRRHQLEAAAAGGNPAPEQAKAMERLMGQAAARDLPVPPAEEISPAQASWQLGNYGDAAGQFIGDNPLATAGALLGGMQGRNGVKYLQEANVGNSIASHAARTNYKDMHPDVVKALRGATPQRDWVPVGKPKIMGGRGLVHANPHNALPGAVQGSLTPNKHQMTEHDFRGLRDSRMGSGGARMRRGLGGAAGFGLGAFGGALADEFFR